MKSKNSKWWLTLAIVCCLTPAVFAAEGLPGRGGQDGRGGGGRGGQGGGGGQGQGGGGQGGGQQVPEGGSTAIYLAGAGFICASGMFLRSKLAKPVQA
jgi:hypothetical protein